jgi:pyridoxine 4-dehydrogenase
MEAIVNEKEVTAKLAGDVSLGKQVSVHRLGFGAMRLTGEGIWGPPKDRNAALAVLRRAVELEVNFIDTADSYGPYVSEELIAEALHPIQRDSSSRPKGAGNVLGRINGPTMRLLPTCVKRWKAASSD